MSNGFRYPARVVTDRTLRPQIPPPGAHGGDSWSLAKALKVDPAKLIDLSASMNPFAPPVGEIIGRIAVDRPEVLGRYPDEHDATKILADSLGVDIDRLVLTNGASEAISLVAAIELTGDVVPPEFSLYERHLRHRTHGGPRWRSNPSNPLGRLADASESARVWDEAFFPIATGTWTRGDDSSWRLGSLTKLWSCPGLRLGFVIAPTAERADAVRNLQPRWSVNALALAALPELLELTDLPRWNDSIRTLRAEFMSRLVELGFAIQDTQANWLLVHREGLREALAPNLVLVRDCTSFGLDGVARVALPDPEQMDEVLRAFEVVGP
jgi:histidinol-phosphate/aromatic aminotransferase/cobyric acid decarboxylase-like protein